MPTLTIDDLTLDVIGAPSWRDGGRRRGRPRAAAFIAAQVSVPASVPMASLDRENARVVLAFDDGSKVEGGECGAPAACPRTVTSYRCSSKAIVWSK
jgi:hypothetical protein